MTRESTIIQAIDTSPLNRGLRGADWVSTPGNVAVVEGEDVTLFDGRGDGVFEVHFLYTSRGRAAIERAKEAFRTLFEVYAGGLIMGLVPDFRRDVKLLARWVGGRSVGIRSTSEGPCELFVLSREMWGMQQ